MARRGRDERTGELAVEVSADTERLDKELKEGIPRRALEGGQEAARSFGRGFADSDDISRDARRAIARVVDRAESTFRETIARADFRLSEGIIDEDEFRRTARRAAEQFNDEISRAERAFEEAGVSDRVRLRLVNEMRDTGEDAVDAYVRQVRDDVGEIDRAMEQAGRRAGQKFGQQATQESRSRFDQLSNWIKGGFIAGIVTSLAFGAQRILQFFRRVARGIQRTLERAGERQQAETAFFQLTSQRGMDPVDTMRQLQRAARGTASEMALLQRTNEALQTGLPATADQLAEIVENSRRVALSMGKDADEGYRRFIQSIVRGRRRIIDDLGIMIDYNAAYQRFAESVDKSADELTEQEKIQARLNAVLEESRRVVADLGPEVLSAGQRVDQLTNFVANLADRSARAAATTPRVREFLNTWGEGAANAADRMGELEDRIGAVIDATISTQNLGRLIDLASAPANMTGALFSFARFRAQAEHELRRRRAETRVRSVSTETDLEALEQRRVELNERLTTLAEEQHDLSVKRAGAGEGTLAIIDQAAKLQAERRNLEMELVALRKRLNELSEGDDSDIAAMTAEEVQQAIDRADQLAEKISDSLQFAIGMAELDLIDPSEIDDAKTLADHLQAVVEATGGDSLAPGEGRGGLLESDPHTEGLREMAEFALEVERSSMSAEEAQLALGRRMQELEITSEELREGTSKLAKEIRDRLLKLLPDWAEEMLRISDNTEGADESTSQLLQDVKDLAQLAGGVLNLADAMGIFGDEASQALQKGVTSAVQLVQAIESIEDLSADASFLSQLGAVGGAAGAAAGLISTVATLITREDPERRRIQEEARELARALDELKQSVQGVRDAFRAGSGSDIEALQSIFGSFQLPEDAFTFVLQTIPELRDQLEGAGVTLSELEAVAEALGIDVGDLITALEGGKVVTDAVVDEIEALQAALQEVSLENITEDFEGQMDLLQQEFDLLDVDDPIEQLRRFREELLELEAVPENIRQALSGADLSTAEGRRQLEAALEAIFQQLQSGQLTPQELGGLTLDQFRGLLSQLEGTLDEAREEAGTTQAFQQVNTLQEVTGNRIAAGIDTIGFYARRQTALQARMVQLLGGTATDALAPPPPAASAASGGGGGTTIALHGDLVVESPPIDSPISTPEAARRFGRAQGEGISEMLAERSLSFEQAQGRRQVREEG